MSILTNRFSQVACSDTYGGFQTTTTEHCASPITFLIAFFALIIKTTELSAAKDTVADGCQQDTVLSYKM